MSAIHLGAYDPNKDYSGKYCLMFHFIDDKNIPHAHCTHKYLGPVSDAVLRTVIETVNEYFNKNANSINKHQIWVFDSFDMFGPEKDTPVLERGTYEGMMLDLKKKLDKIVPDEYPHYRPHVSIPNDYPRMPIVMQPYKYVLSSGGIVVKEWQMCGIDMVKMSMAYSRKVNLHGKNL